MATSVSTAMSVAVPALLRPRYAVRLASTAAERRAAFRLRFEVFNVELKEGLDRSFTDRQDVDRFDGVCDHLIVESPEGAIVGTYRVQTGVTADRNLGFYSEQEFDFTPYR